jgi:sortase B
MDRDRVWKAAATFARGADHLLNAAIALMLVTAILYGGFGVWDTWKIYQQSELSSELQKYKPTAGNGDESNPIIKGLQKINPDVRAWLTVDGTNIDYPVVQGLDNMTYLNWSVDMKFSLSGSLFLDYQNSGDFSDRYSLIYGHHMESRTMFGELPEFLEEDFFGSHQTGVIFTPEHTYYIEWFACLKTDAYDGMMYYTRDYSNEESIKELLSYIKENAVQFRDIGAQSSDRFIALTTCTTDTTDGRVVLIGKIS